MQEMRFNSWVKKIPWRKKWQPTPVFLSRKSHGQRDLKTSQTLNRKPFLRTQIHELYLWMLRRDFFSLTLG